MATLEITAVANLPDQPLEVVERIATGMADALREVERDAGLELGPVASVNSETRAAIVYFTCESDVLARIGSVLIAAGKASHGC